MVDDLDCNGIEFPVSKKDYSRVEQKNNICIDVFCYENCLTYPVHVSNEKFEKCMDFLMIEDKNKSQYFYIKDFNKFMCNKTKNKNKKRFCRYCWQFFSREKVLEEYQKVYLKINSKQNLKLSDSIKFKNYLKQLAVPFKIYTDFDSTLRGVKNKYKNNASYTKKYQAHVPCSFTYKDVWNDDKFSKPVVLYRGKNTVNKFVKAILKEYGFWKK